MPSKEAKQLSNVGRGTSKITGVSPGGPGTSLNSVGSIGTDPYSFPESTRVRRGPNPPENNKAKMP